MGDPHSGFIIAAYAIAGGTIAAMIGWVVRGLPSSERPTEPGDAGARERSGGTNGTSANEIRLKPPPHLPDTGRVITDSAGVMKWGTRRTPKGWWLYIPEKQNV